MDFIVSAISPIWKVLLVGLVLGAGLPALYAVGMKSLASGTSGSDGTAVRGASPAGITGAVICFAIVLLAVAFGLCVLVGGSGFLKHFGMA